MVPVMIRCLLDSEYDRRIVNGLRAMGIILVVAFHGAFVFAKVLPRPKFDAFVETMPAALNVVWQALGSEIVFFSSGFLLSYLLIREKSRYGSIDVRDFWIRRGSRIVPLFLLALAVFMIGRRFHWDRVLTNLAFSARLAGFFGITVNGGKNYIPVGWSLEVMVHAYLLLPFLVRGVLATRWPLLVALALAALSVVPRYLALAADPAAYTLPVHTIIDIGDVPQIHKDLYYLTWFRLTPFLLGLAAAVAVMRHSEWLQRWCASRWRSEGTLIVGATLVVASGFLPLHRAGSMVYELFGPREWLWFWSCQRVTLIVGVALVFLTVLVSQHGVSALVGRFLAMRFFAPISHGIYSIYLFHFVCLVPAALIVFLPAVIEGVAKSPSFDRHALQDSVYGAIDSASVWHYLCMVVIAVWLSARLATFLTRVVEAPVQNWVRTAFPRRSRVLLPEVADAESVRREVAAAGPDRVSKPRS